jgi:uncharacterized membrane protein
VTRDREAAQARLDLYLDQVRRYLHGLSETERAEIVAELRSHVLDRVEGEFLPDKVDAALAALGAPRQVAQLNLSERMAERVAQNRSPLTVLGAVGRLAGASLYGFFTFLVSIIGYGIAAGFLLTAVVKPFAPDRAGLFVSGPHSFSLGVVDHSATAHELLGWWIIPIGVIIGALAAWLTWRFGIFSVRLMGRRPRPGRA